MGNHPYVKSDAFGTPLAVAALALLGVIAAAADAEGQPGATPAAAASLSGGAPVAERPTARSTPARTTGEQRVPRRRVSVTRLSPDTKILLDRSGRTRTGKASFYAKMFAGRKMADGTPMRPSGNNAASLTLPLGTRARVTNLETGKTAVVVIRDRGPYVAGRIVDLSPATAEQIGLDRRTGVARVEVAPIAVPMPDGEMKRGDAMLEANNGIGPRGNSTP